MSKKLNEYALSLLVTLDYGFGLVHFSTNQFIMAASGFIEKLKSFLIIDDWW